MRKLWIALVGATAVLIPAQAQADANYGYCIGSVRGQSDMITPIFKFPPVNEYVSIHRQFERFVENRFDREPWHARCEGFDTESEALDWHARYSSSMAQRGETLVEITGFIESLTDKPARSVSRPTTPKPQSEADAGPATRRKTKADYDAEFAVKQAAYERELAEQERKVEEFEQAKRDLAQRQSEQKAAAQQALNQHADAMRQHDAVVAKYQEDVRAAAQASLLADFDKRHGLGQASTDTDANRCVTTPETQQNVSFKGNTAASVVNGCGQPVDVRICLMTADGWNCGVTYGLAGQAKWSWSSMNATGPVFMDARVAGSNRPFASPQ